MSSYFSLPSFARAKKNKEDLEKTNPKNPVLKDDDEQFLNKQIESEDAPSELKDAPPTVITEDGQEKEASQEQKEQAGSGADQVAVPEEKPPSEDATAEPKTEDLTQGSEGVSKPEDTVQESAPEAPAESANTASESTGETSRTEETAAETAEDPPEQVPGDSKPEEFAAAKAKKPKRNKSFELPSQEEAEAATRGFNTAAPPQDSKQQGEQGEKRTWASYLPTNLRTSVKKDGDSKDKAADETAVDEKPTDDKTTEDKPAEDKPAEDKPAEEQKESQADSQSQQRTWAEYASSAYQALPSIPAIRSSGKSKDKDSDVEPVLNEDGTINEEKTKEKQEKEVSVLLDHLNLSSINNRVFAFSGETEKIYERFAQVLKDTMNGAPTAYEDMDKLMKDAGPQLEKQFQSMPPFVQTLVKSLPAKLGTSLGPELLAAASEKPGADMKTKMQAASKPSGGDAGFKTADASSDTKSEGKETQKKKRRIPGLKGLISEQGAVASILRNVVTFLKVRFPFLASTTNVVMSLAVFILMFVFWYSHKRGKEVRLAREADAAKAGESIAEGEDDDVEVDVTDEEGADDEADEEKEVVEEVAQNESSAEAAGEVEKAEEPAEEAATQEKRDEPSETVEEEKAEQPAGSTSKEEKAEEPAETAKEGKVEEPAKTTSKEEKAEEPAETTSQEKSVQAAQTEEQENDVSGAELTATKSTGVGG